MGKKYYSLIIKVKWTAIAVICDSPQRNQPCDYELISQVRTFGKYSDMQKISHYYSYHNL